jgi:hypothetical protein
MDERAQNGGIAIQEIGDDQIPRVNSATIIPNQFRIAVLWVNAGGTSCSQ